MSAVRFCPNATGDLHIGNVLVALVAELVRRQHRWTDYIVRYDAEFRGPQFTDMASQVMAALVLWGIEPTRVYSTHTESAQRECLAFLARLRDKRLIDTVPIDSTQPCAYMRKLLGDGHSEDEVKRLAKAMWNIDADFVDTQLSLLRLCLKENIVEDLVTSRAFLVPEQPHKAFGRSPAALTSYGAAPLAFCLRECLDLGVRFIVRHQQHDLQMTSLAESEFYRRIGLPVEFVFLPALCDSLRQPLTKSLCVERGQQSYRARDWFWRHRDDPAMPQEHVGNVARTHLMNLVLKQPWPILTLDEMAERFEWDMLTDQDRVVVE